MLTTLPEYKALKKHYEYLKNIHLTELFDKHPDRGNKFNLKAEDISLDYSKNIISDETLTLFFKLLKNIALEEKIANQPPPHIALRNVSSAPDEVIMTLDKMRDFANSIRTKKWLGASGKPIKNIINIGIGGSNLGSVMAYEALKNYSSKLLTFGFISNVDGDDFYEKTSRLNPEETLFTVASKTFTTMETLTNAQSAKNWITSNLQSDESVAAHFVALTANGQAAQEFGINSNNILPLWDWVGGRYSLMSAIGLPLMIAIGPKNFDSMRQGANSIDNHFINTPLEKNLPVILAILGVWYNNFFNTQTYGTIPYSYYLHRLPAFLQQLDMESSGKSVTINNENIDYQTGPIVFGEPGTDAQHSFFQLIHQGTKLIPLDLIGFHQSNHNLEGHHKILLANLSAQAEALAFGKENREEPHRNFPGNKPTNTIILEKLTPNTLGQLIALYEHKVFVQGKIWDINSFDQFGVELGKELAQKILKKDT